MTNLTNSPGWDKLPIYIVWSVEFLTIGVSNLLVALSIIYHVALRDRKEYLVILGLCFSDFIYVGSFFMAAVYRTKLLFTGEHNSYSVFWDCFKQPYTQGWILSMHLSPLMLVIVSLDRLLSVAKPTQYLNFGKQYGHRMLGCAYGYCITFYIVIAMLGYDKRDQQVFMTAPCYVAEVVLPVHHELALYFLYCGPIFGLISVVLYVIVGFSYCYQKHNLVAAIHLNGGYLQQAEKKRQRKLTKSLGISCVCTLCFFVIPIGLTFTGEFFKFPRLLMQILWLLPNLNPGCNVLIYMKRQPELVEGVKAMLCCKTLPPVVGLWKSNTKHVMSTAFVGVEF